MKGLYYSFFLLRKNDFIFPAIAAVISTVTICLLLAFAENEDVQAITVMLALIAPIICGGFPSEAICKDLENSMKNRFLNYVLSGMTPARYCNTELIKNLLTTAFGLVTVCLCDLAFWLIDNTVPFSMLAIHIAAIIIMNGVMNWLLMPLVIKVKNSDKAGIIVGLVLGFLLLPCVIPIMENEGAWSKFLTVMDNPVTLLIVLAAAAVMYAVGYPIIYRTIKRGDIC